MRGRIEKLLDAGSPFLELSALAGYDMYGSDDVKSGGMVTGIGIINKRFCMIVANDPTVKGYNGCNLEELIIRLQLRSISELRKSLYRINYPVYT